MATQLSKSALVAPILIATENPCSSSSAPIPITCRPTTYGHKRQANTLVIPFVLGFAHIRKIHLKWKQHTHKHTKEANFNVP